VDCKGKSFIEITLSDCTINRKMGQHVGTC
jgi:hypothetical protein